MTFTQLDSPSLCKVSRCSAGGAAGGSCFLSDFSIDNDKVYLFFSVLNKASTSSADRMMYSLFFFKVE